jgi:hypothetical protein
MAEGLSESAMIADSTRQVDAVSENSAWRVLI